MTTICITLPALKTITRGLSSDWGPTLHAAARRLGAVVALLYTLGFMAGERWRQLGAWAQEHQLHGLARLGLPGSNLKVRLTGSATEESSAAPAMVVGIDIAGPEGSATVQTIVQRRPRGNYPESPDGSAARVVPVLMVQRLAPALPPARQAANFAPLSIRHLAAQGCSQREIAGTLGLTRYQVRKALAA
jgi:hypothetical protein